VAIIIPSNFSHLFFGEFSPLGDKRNLEICDFFFLNFKCKFDPKNAGCGGVVNRKTLETTKLNKNHTCLEDVKKTGHCPSKIWPNLVVCTQI
jgi:hypothetical protein